MSILCFSSLCLLWELVPVFQPIEVREARPELANKVEKVGVILPVSLQKELDILTAIESGRYSVFY